MYQQNTDFIDTDLYVTDFNIDKLSNLLHKQQYTIMVQLISALFKFKVSYENLCCWGNKTPYYVLHMKPAQIDSFERALRNTLRNCNHLLSTNAQAPSLPSRAFWHLYDRLTTHYYKWRLPC